MFVKGSGEVHVEELLMIDGEGHHPAGKTEVTKMVWINIRVTVGLECGTWEGGREGGRREGEREGQKKESGNCDNSHSSTHRLHVYHQQTV